MTWCVVIKICFWGSEGKGSTTPNDEGSQTVETERSVIGIETSTPYDEIKDE